MTMKTNLFIIGAPKCGTTSLVEWLKQHSEVYFPNVKEPHFFYNPYGKKVTKEEYQKLYEACEPQKSVIGDASVWYLFSKDAVNKIIQYNEDAKFIVCLRDPVDLAVSLHAQKLFTGHEMETDFAKAWSLSSERSKGAMAGIFGIPNGDSAHMAYSHSCLLGEQVQSLLKNVKMSKVHFCLLSELANEPNKTFSNICKFLGINNNESILFKKHNQATVRKSQLMHRILLTLSGFKKVLGIKSKVGILKNFYAANSMASGYNKPTESLTLSMKEYFKEDVELLEKLTGKKL